jgi:hypothetical protein
MMGAVSLKQPENRLCTLDARIIHPVEFGFGVLGHIDEGGHFSLTRRQVDAKNWKSDRISVHVTGRILMLKSLAQDQDSVRTGIRVVPQNLTVAQAAQIIRQESAPASTARSPQLLTPRIFPIEPRSSTVLMKQ